MSFFARGARRCTAVFPNALPALALLGSAAHAGLPCAPSLIDNGLPGPTGGTNALVMTSFGGDLYLGQASDVANDGYGLMRRVDNRWVPVGGGVFSTTAESLVSDFAAFDPDGAGPAQPLLIACGQLDASNVQGNIIAWDGLNYVNIYNSPLPVGVISHNGWIRSMAVFDPDGVGPLPESLIAVGSFSSFRGDPLLRQIVRWDGITWSGMFNGLGSTPFTSTFYGIKLVTVDPDGPGPMVTALYMLCTDASVSPKCMFVWNVAGQQWEPAGTFTNDEGEELIWDMVSFDPDGVGPEPVSLVAAGTVFGAKRVAYRSSLPGNPWQPLPGAPGGVFANPNTFFVSLATIDPDGAGLLPQTLYMGRGFEFGGAAISQPLYSFDGSVYSAIAPNGLVATRGLDVLSGLAQDQGRPTLYLAGQSGGPPYESRALRIQGSASADAASSRADAFALLAPQDVRVTALGTVDSTVLGVDRPTLIVATEGPMGMPRGFSGHTPLQAWNGEHFTPYAPCVLENSVCCVETPIVKALATVDPDGSGPLTEADGLAMVGDFDSIDLLDGLDKRDAFGIAVWNGSTWIRPNIFNPGPVINCVASLPPTLAGGVPAVFVGGQFTAIGGVGCSNAALWFPGGLTWHGMFGGVDGAVKDAVVFDPDGIGTTYSEALYVAGDFLMAGGQMSRGIAVWNGTAWSPLPQGDPDGSVSDLQLWDFDGPGGSSPRLAIAGGFSSVGMIATSGAGYLDSSGWHELGDATGFEYLTRLGVLDPDRNPSSGEKLYGIITDMDGNRRLGGNRQNGGTSSVWDTVARFGPSSFDGLIVLETVDDDGDDLHGDSLVIAGDVGSAVEGIPTDGLIRLTAPTRYLVNDINATLNGAGAYLCLSLPGATDDVVFDATAVSSNPDEFIFADLISGFSVGTMSVLSGNVNLNLFSNMLQLNQPGSRPSLVIGDGRDDPVSMFIYDDNGLGVLRAVDVEIGQTGPQSAVSSLTVSSAQMEVQGDLRIAVGAGVGELFLVGPTSLLTTGGGQQQVGLDAGSEGALYFDSAAQWMQAGGGTLSVGVDGTGLALLQGGAHATTAFSVINVGEGAGGVGILELGASSLATWDQTGGGVFIGHEGSGIMRVANGSMFNGFGTHLIVGHIGGSDGLLTVSQQDPKSSPSRVNVSQLSVGVFGGAGRVLLDGFGTVDAQVEAQSITIGTGGEIEGMGQLQSPLVGNRGLLSPGEEPRDANGRTPNQTGTIQVVGDYAQLSAPANDGIPGKLVIDFEGVAPSERDSVFVDGQVTLGGQLDVRFLNGYRPSEGDFAAGIEVISSTLPIVGVFDVANFPGLPAGVTGLPRFLRFENRVGAAARGATSSIVVVETTLASPPPAPAESSQNYDVGGAGTDADLGDLDGDGTLDVAITIPDSSDPVNNPGSIALLFNAGSAGGFWQGFANTVQITVSPNPSAIVIADFDGVNGNDLCFTSLTNGTVEVMLNDGAGHFSNLRGAIPPLPVADGPRQLINSDFNRDGGIDVAVVTVGEPTCTVLFNSRPSTGAFTGFINPQVIPIPPTAASGVAVDIDNDKWDDIVIPDTNDTSIAIQNNGPLAARGNRGAMVFNPTPVLTQVPGDSADVDAADLNMDGFNDVAFATEAGDSVTILLGDGTPTFLPPITVPAGDGPTNLRLIDLDSDGDADIAVITTDEMGQRIVRIIRNDLFDGQLSFATQDDLVPGATPELVLGGDVTGDGNPDLVTVNNEGGVRRGATEDDVSVFVFAVCRGDANNDRVIDMEDISATLTNWQMDYSPGTGPGDSNGDGLCDFRDITAVLTSWGRDCR